jgi:site-specific DNA recombinase
VTGFLRIARRLNAEGIASPRPGRLGWQTSGVREIALRDLYRGRQVYGRTRWEDREGTKRKITTPPSEWITVEVPELRVIDDALWNQAHARMAETRALYARLTDGKLIGRPGCTLEARYLLTGFLRCALCDGAVFVSKQPSRGRMLWYYICAARRVGSACPGGGVRIAMERLDAAVLDTIEATLLTPERLQAIVERAAARQRIGPSRAERQSQIERQLREAQARVERYVRAIGEGLDLREVRDKLQEAKSTVVTLEAQLAALAGCVPGSVTDRERIERRIADWRGILRRGPVMARQILRKILPGRRPLALTPLEGGGVSFKAEVAWAGLFAGTSYVSLVVPPG